MQKRDEAGSGGGGVAPAGGRTGGTVQGSEPVALRSIERLRDYRTRPAAGSLLGEEAARVCGALEREARRLGAAGRAWAETAAEGLGPELMASVRAVRVSRGVLWVEAEHAAARYRTEAWLRGGGEAAVITRAGRGKIHGVRVAMARRRG